MAQTVETPQDELTRRHRTAVTAIVSVLVLTIVLTLLSVAGRLDITLSRNPAFEGALRIAIVIFGLGAVVMRRTMFSAMRLKDIAALGGATALLETLQKTTVYVALLAAAITFMGFILGITTGAEQDRWLGVLAVAVLIYAYPRRSAWQRVLQTTAPDSDDNAPAAKGTIA